MHPHDRGIANALSEFGLDKTAGVLDWLGTALVGSPREFARQLGEGELFKSPHGFYRHALIPRNPETGKVMPLPAALNIGMPALALYGASKVAPEYRGSAYGEVLGGTIGGMAGGPLGILGQMAGSHLMGQAGRSVGGYFDQGHTFRREPLEMPNGKLPIQRAVPGLSDQMSKVTGTPAL